jgi:hypothetical protein
VASYAIFEVYVANNISDIEKGNEVVCEVFCNDDASIHLVKAKISKNPDGLTDPEELMVRNDEGRYIKDNPWAIQIVEELDPDDYDLSPPMSSVKPMY